MDRECVTLLPRVFEVLLDSDRSLPDDTSLEKLLDWFTGLTEQGGSLSEAYPCLLEFISAVVHKTSSHPDVISFTLKLCGLLGATEDGFKMLQKSYIVDIAFNHQHWYEAGLWKDPCIRIGWIQGLRSMLKHLEALTFFVQADSIAPLLQLQTDSSIFVASAANQMLTHILLFFQPVLPIGCNGEDKKHRDDISTHSSITDVDHPGVTTETRRDYTAVVVTISDYLKESLVSNAHVRLNQSRQILKLLALLLAQARPPLRDKLLGTVADPLLELVTADYSQLTVPLMDMILAAYSPSSSDDCVPDQCITHLLSSMLNTNTPTDLIHAAAAFLRRGHPDTVHTAQAARILLLPLYIITGQTVLGTNTEAEEHQVSMVELLRSKTPCISIICVCLTTTPRITLVPLHLLPCPPGLIVTAVLSLLRICSGDFSSSTGFTDVARNVIGSGKVQKCALEAVMGLGSNAEVKGMLIEVFTVLIQYLNNPDSDPIVIHKSYQALLKWISVSEDLSSITYKLRQGLSDAVKKRVCDMRWEVRDSTVEFLGKLAGVLESAECVRNGPEDLLGQCCTALLLREALQDPESYVRASAITALSQTLAHSGEQGDAVTPEQTDVVGRLLEILSEDTEGFARRAVVQYFVTWFSSRASHASPPSSASLLISSVSSVLSQGSVDLDWEVKVHTLELAELLLDEAFSGRQGYKKCSETPRAPLSPYAAVSEQTYRLHTPTGMRVQSVESDLAYVLSNLVEQGVLSPLLSGLVDCDRPVALKACHLLIALRETVCPVSLESPVAGVSCELPECGWGQEIRKILKMKKCEEVKGADTTTKSQADGNGETREEGEAGNNLCVGVCVILRSLGLDARQDILSQSSDHVYNSPLSLLQDILTAKRAHSLSDTQPGQEVIVDCY